jgi:hypothetical protein
MGQKRCPRCGHYVRRGLTKHDKGACPPSVGTWYPKQSRRLHKPHHSQPHHGWNGIEVTVRAFPESPYRRT